MYLLGTVAPDNEKIPLECNAPNTGYGDWRQGHSVEWLDDFSEMIKDRAARRAEAEYQKAVTAFQNGNHSHAAYYLSSMAHYIGDVSQYGHSVPFEDHHSDFESWVGTRTKEFNSVVFSQYIELDNLVSRKPYTAVKRISKKTAGGSGHIIWPTQMDILYPEKNNNQAYIDSVGFSLNLGVNELADVLHRFYLNAVER